MIKNKEKFKRILMACVSFAFMVSIAGYINYKYNPEREKNLGKTIYVNGKDSYMYENVSIYNEEEINNDAGKSSDMIHPSLNYRNDKIIGINNGNGTRSDRKTQNNYTLNYGFKLGKKSLNINKC